MAEPESIAPDRTHGDGIAVELGGGAFAIFSHGAQPMSLFTPADGRIVEVNDAWVEKYGYTREEAHRMKVQDVSAEPLATTNAVRGAERTGGAIIDVRWHRDKRGDVFPVEITSGTLRIGSRVLMYAVMNDISERLKAEARLLHSEARFRALVEHIPIGVVVHREGRIVYMNPELRKLLGYEDWSDQRPLMLRDLVPKDELPRVLERVATIESGRPTPSLQGGMVRRDGVTVPLEINAIPFEFDGQPAVLAMTLDLRERKRMEAQLVLADRLAALGRLAASVGHEINNPLAYLLGNIQLLERELAKAKNLDAPLQQTFRERFEVLQEGVLRVRDIVRDLKSLSGGEMEPVEGADLHRVLDMCIHMAEHEIKKRASVERNYGEPVAISASEPRLGQVFLNLLVNAAQSIPEGAPDKNLISVTTRRVGPDRIVVEVRDTGPGIPDALRDRIFEPFFTTKASGGTGLGLSISHSIVTGLGGSITMEPVEPHGTCFRVELPCRAPISPQEPPPRQATLPNRLRRGLRVLVADDEQMLADVIAASLDDCDVSVVHSGEAAISKLEQRDFDAILLDVHLSDGSGADVARWLREHRPEARERVILMTAGAVEAPLDAEIADLPLLRKPFEHAGLLREIERLDTPRDERA